MENNLTPEKAAEIADKIAAGNKLDAIKLYRAATGGSLAQAKAFVEDLAVELHQKDPQRFAAPPAGEKKGCLGTAAVLATLTALAVFLTL